MKRTTLGVAAMLGACSLAFAAGPNVIVHSVGPGVNKYGSVNVQGTMVTGYAVTTISCNIGDQNAIWIECVQPGNPLCNQHPVIGQNMFRIKDGRFEQIGQSWLKHGFCALDEPSCGSPYVPHGSCDWLGIHATDTYGASLNGEQSLLGPKSEVDPWTGVFPYPYIKGWNLTGNAVYKRLQVKEADLEPAANPGALYFAESQYICTDEPAENRYNNVSHRQILVGSYSNGWTLAFAGNTVTQQPAFIQWEARVPGVTTVIADVPGDGRFMLGYRVVQEGEGGLWSYEYALYNMNSERGARSFTLPVSDLVSVTEIGFRDVPYHSGELFEDTDWTVSHGGGSLRWSTGQYLLNPNANALRWGTVYNFRFKADQPPVEGEIALEMYKGSTLTVMVPAVVPQTPPACAGDIDGSGSTDTTDLNIVLSDFGCVGAGCAGDIDGSGATDTTDLNIILSDFGCTS